MNPLRRILRRRRPPEPEPDQTPSMQPLICPHCRSAGQPFRILHSPLPAPNLTIVLTCAHCHQDTPMHADIGKIKIRRGSP